MCLAHLHKSAHLTFTYLYIGELGNLEMIIIDPG